jgi:hypothetical protein
MKLPIYNMIKYLYIYNSKTTKPEIMMIEFLFRFFVINIMISIKSKVISYFTSNVINELQKKRIHIERIKPQVGFESLAKV